MPIGIDKFEKDNIPSVPSVMAKALAYLYTNPEKAFTSTEVAKAIDEDVETTSVMLVRLLRQDLARQKGDYWAIVKNTDKPTEMYDMEPLIDSLGLKE